MNLSDPSTRIALAAFLHDIGKLAESEGDAVSEFSRIIGHRHTPLLGALRAPSADERVWVARMAPSQTRVPKGVFRYRSLQEASADWERWQADAVTAGRKP